MLDNDKLGSEKIAFNLCERIFFSGMWTTLQGYADVRI